MINILCFGDSNTFGTNPHGGRHPWNIRWPGRLQKLLGPGYYVIEEGLGGRTTVWDDPLEPGRSGIQALPMALSSHKPLDLVILALGVNDCKAHLNASPRVIAKGMENLCELVQNFDYGPGYKTPQILIVSPVHIGDDMDHCPYISFDETSPDKSRRLAPLYEQVAASMGCLFFDASTVARASSLDQLHLDANGHEALAEGILNIVRSCFES